MKCDECKFCKLEDYGYSNYTVEGTDISCILDLNPKFPADHRWGEASELEYAKECSRYSKGDPISIDVDHESGHILNYVYDDEVRKIVEKEVVWDALKS